MTTSRTVARVEVLGYSKDKRPPWNTLTDSILAPVSEATARKRHAGGTPYGVVVSDGAGLVAIALGGADNRYARVEFLDPTHTFAALSHHLVDDGAGGLRLHTIWRANTNPQASPPGQLVRDTFTWGDESGRWFRADGGGSGLVEEREGIDRAALTVPWPGFGEYAPLLDRGLLARAWPGVPDLPILQDPT